MNVGVLCTTTLFCLTVGYQPITMANAAVTRTVVAVGVGLRASIVPLRNGVATRAQGKVAKHVTKKVGKKNTRKKAQKQRRRYILMKRSKGTGWEQVTRFKSKVSACGARGIRRTAHVGKNVQFIVKKKAAVGNAVKVNC